MSVRPDSRKGKDKIKMTTRDIRLYKRLVDQKQLEDEKNVSGRLSAINRPSTKKTTSKRIYVQKKQVVDEGNIHLKNAAIVQKNVNLRIKKLFVKPKISFKRDLWAKHGPSRRMFLGDAFEKYQNVFGRTNSYEGILSTFQPCQTTVKRSFARCEHQDRLVVCAACGVPEKSTSLTIPDDFGISYHHSCWKNLNK